MTLIIMPPILGLFLYFTANMPSMVRFVWVRVWKYLACVWPSPHSIELKPIVPTALTTYSPCCRPISCLTPKIAFPQFVQTQIEPWLQLYSDLFDHISAWPVDQHCFIILAKRGVLWRQNGTGYIILASPTSALGPFDLSPTGTNFPSN
jgi:hypothetical protein